MDMQSHMDMESMDTMDIMKNIMDILNIIEEILLIRTLRKRGTTLPLAHLHENEKKTPDLVKKVICWFFFNNDEYLVFFVVCLWARLVMRGLG